MNHEGNPTLPPAPQPGPTNPGGATPATPPPATPWWSRHWRIALPAAGIVLAGAVGAAALVLFLKPNPTIEKMVPATMDVYAVANLDPSVSQKLDLLQAVHRFPATRTDAAIAAKLDQGFKDSGVSYTGDIAPWLGSEIGFAVRLNGTATDTRAALFAVSRDDGKARAFLTKLRTASKGKKNQRHDESYDGVAISVGTPIGSAGANGKQVEFAAYAMVDHVAVIATSDALIRDIVDTDKGRAARLVDASDYKATLMKLPADRVGLLYVDGKSIVRELRSAMTKTSSVNLPALKGLGDLDALQGLGMAVWARPDGIVADLAVKFDASKLSPITRAALTQAGTPSAVLDFIPKTTQAFLAGTNINRGIQSLLDQAGNDPSVKQATDELGLTGPKGVLAHLTGLEAELDRSSFPAGAIMFGTNDAAGMRAFFGGLLAIAAETQGISATPTITSYQGVTITSLTIPEYSLGGHFVPSYAVVQGMGILASTPSELRAIIDAHRSHASVATASTYAAGMRASLAKPSAIFYVDIASLIAVVQHAPAGSPVSALGSKAVADLAPLQGLIVTATGGADAALERFVILIH